MGLERTSALVLALLAVFAAGAALVALEVFNHDVAWMMVAADKMLDGAVLYKDVIEINPPLIVWLSAVPVLVSQWLGISSILVFRVLTFALAALSATVCNWVLRAALVEVALRRGLLLVTTFAIVVMPGYDFGQREHLFVMLVMPYLFAAAARAEGVALSPALAWSVGVLAGLGFALKPYFVPLWLVLHVYLWARRERRRLLPESFAILAVLTAYALSLLALVPQYFTMVNQLSEAYQHFSTQPWSFFVFHRATIYLGWISVGIWYVRPRGLHLQLGRVMLMAGWWMLAAALIQGKGFPYHFYPAYAFSALLAWLLLVEVDRQRERFGRVVTWGLAAALLVLTGIYLRPTVQAAAFWRGDPEATPTDLGELMGVVRQHGAGEPILVLHGHIPPTFPLVNYTNCPWPWRFCSLWALSGIYARQPDWNEPIDYRRERAHAVETFVVDSLVDDVTREPPRLLIVDVSPHKRAFRNLPFDYVTYFSGDARFAAFFAGYEPLERTEGFQVYRRR